MLFEVSSTYGRCVATKVPISGTEIWNSPRVSRSTASSASSARSTSSISSTTGCSERMASSSGRGARKRSEKNTLSWDPMRSTAEARSGASETSCPIFSRRIWVYISCLP